MFCFLIKQIGCKQLGQLLCLQVHLVGHYPLAKLDIVVDMIKLDVVYALNEMFVQVGAITGYLLTFNE